jgi:hypothetical protein
MERYFIFAFVIFLAALGSQRFMLETIYSYICIVPLIGSILYFKKNKSVSLSLLIISLFLSVDNGAGEYSETISFIRYIIYSWCIFFMVYGSSISLSRLLIYVSFILLPVLITLFNIHTIDITTLIRDISIISIIGIAFIQTGKSVNMRSLEKSSLFLFFTVFLLLEVLNSAFYYSIENGHYLNYNSLKGLIAFSSFYLISEKKYLAAFFVGLITIFVMLDYGTRFSLLVFLLITIFYIMLEHSKRINKKFVFTFTISCLFLYLIITNLDNDTKFGFMLGQMWISTSIQEWIVVIDPVRYYENLMFFNRDILSILFGNGLGSGLHDTEGYLNFVRPEQYAFTVEELNNKIYYNLHDFWVDVGLRFGLFNVILFVFFVTNRLLKDVNKSNVNLIFLFLIFTVFYSIAGILLISIFLLLSSNKLADE